MDNLFEGDFHFRKFFHADGRNSMQISLADIIGGERAFNGTIELTIGSHRMDYHALKVIKYTFNYSQGYGVVYDSNLSSDISISIDLSNSYPIFTIHAPREDSLLSVFMDIYRSNGAGHL